MARRFVVTGASGFVGRALRPHLAGAVQPLRLGGADWRANIAACDLEGAVVIHLAARVHATVPASEADYERDNVEKTRELATRAARSGAERLVFVSSIKVNGEHTSVRPFRRDDAPDPRDAYARSKWAAERALAAIAGDHGLAVTIVRPPLVYGPGAKSNLAKLLRIADTAWPLPFASLHNRRSFIHADDLARLLVRCADTPRAAGATYLAAHRETISTASLVTLMRGALGRPARLFATPGWCIEAAAAMAGQRGRAQSLTRSLEVDVAATEAELDWSARIGPKATVEELVAAYRSARRS